MLIANDHLWNWSKAIERKPELRRQHEWTFHFLKLSLLILMEAWELWAVSWNKSQTLCHSNIFFRNRMHGKTFRVNGVFTAHQTGRFIKQNFPFRSAAMMAVRLCTPYVINGTKLHILTARGLSLFYSNWPTSKQIIARLSQAQNRKLAIRET